MSDEEDLARYRYLQLKKKRFLSQEEKLSDVVSKQPETFLGKTVDVLKDVASYPLGLPANPLKIYKPISEGNVAESYYELMPQFEKGAAEVKRVKSEAIGNFLRQPRTSDSPIGEGAGWAAADTALDIAPFEPSSFAMPFLPIAKSGFNARVIPELRLPRLPLSKPERFEEGLGKSIQEMGDTLTPEQSGTKIAQEYQKTTGIPLAEKLKTPAIEERYIPKTGRELLESRVAKAGSRLSFSDVPNETAGKILRSAHEGKLSEVNRIEKEAWANFESQHGDKPAALSNTGETIQKVFEKKGIAEQPGKNIPDEIFIEPIVEKPISKRTQKYLEQPMHRLVRRMGVDPEKSSDIRELGDKSLIRSKKKGGVGLDTVREYAAEEGLIPKDSTPDDVIKMLQDEKLGKTSYGQGNLPEEFIRKPIDAMEESEINQKIRQLENKKKSKGLAAYEEDALKEFEDHRNWMIDEGAFSGEIGSGEIGNTDFNFGQNKITVNLGEMPEAKIPLQTPILKGESILQRIYKASFEKDLTVKQVLELRKELRPLLPKQGAQSDVFGGRLRQVYKGLTNDLKEAADRGGFQSDMDNTFKTTREKYKYLEKPSTKSIIEEPYASKLPSKLISKESPEQVRELFSEHNLTESDKDQIGRNIIDNINRKADGNPHRWNKLWNEYAPEVRKEIFRDKTDLVESIAETAKILDLEKAKGKVKPNIPVSVKKSDILSKSEYELDQIMTKSHMSQLTQKIVKANTPEIGRTAVAALGKDGTKILRRSILNSLFDKTEITLPNGTKVLKEPDVAENLIRMDKYFVKEIFGEDATKMEALTETAKFYREKIAKYRNVGNVPYLLRDAKRILNIYQEYKLPKHAYNILKNIAGEKFADQVLPRRTLTGFPAKIMPPIPGVPLVGNETP